MSGAADFLPKAIEFSNEAVQADKDEKYEDAINLYMKALEYFMLAIKWEKNAARKKSLQGKAEEYLNRTEQLKQFVNEEKNKKNVASPNGEASKQKKKNSDDDEDEESAKMKKSLGSAILSEKPNVKWDDVAGLETAKDALKEAVIFPLKFPQLYTGKRKPFKGILLYGPPGTGKSYLAKALATEANSTFFTVSSSDLVSKWLGESQKLVRNLFEMARDNKPAIIFIDEIDSLCKARNDNQSDASAGIVTEFLVQMNGVGKDEDGVLVLAATNIPWAIDAAIRRRLEKRIYIPLPELHARAKMIEIHLGNTPHNLTKADFTELAVLVDGYSGSDINVMVREALMEPVRKVKEATHFRVIENGKLEPCSPGAVGAQEMSWTEIDGAKLNEPIITKNDFLAAVARSKPSVGKEDLVKQLEFTEQFGQEGN